MNEAPSFTLSSYSGVIAENSANGVDVITIPATDPDSGDTLTYSLSGSGTLRLIEVREIFVDKKISSTLLQLVSLLAFHSEDL